MAGASQAFFWYSNLRLMFDGKQNIDAEIIITDYVTSPAKHFMLLNAFY